MAGLGTTLTALLVLLATVAIAKETAPAPSTAATAFLPPAGHHEVMLSSQRRVQTLDFADLPGAKAIMTGPQSFIATGLDLTEQLSRRWLRLTRTYLTATGSPDGRSDTLYAQTAEGLIGHVSDNGSTFLSFQPGLIELPAQLALGASWQSSGQALSGAGLTITGTASYHYAATADAPSKPELAAAGCLTVSGLLTLDRVPQRSVTTWCPGRGIVADQDTTTIWTSVPTFPETADPRRLVDLARTTGVMDPATAHLTSIDTTTAPITVTPGDGPLFGHSGGVALLRGSGDLLGFTLTKAGLERRWRAFPGGQVTTRSQFGDLTVVCTTGRQLVAYDATGQWLWSTQVSDVARRPFTRLDAATMVGSFVDGRVGAYDLRTGALRWEYDVGGELQLSPAVDEGRVVIAAVSGDVSVLSSAGVLQYSASFPDRIRSLAAGGGLIYGDADGDGRIFALDAATGAPRWEWVERETRSLLQPVPGGLLVASRDDLYLLDPAGARLWTAPGAGTVAILGGHVIVATAEQVVAIGMDGRKRGTWTMPSHPDDPGTRWITAAPGGDVIVTDATFRMVRIGR